MEVPQQPGLQTPSPPPRHSLTIIATEFVSDLILVSGVSAVRLPTVTVRIMATLKWTVLRRELSGVLSRAAVSQPVKLTVAVRWVQHSQAPH